MSKRRYTLTEIEYRLRDRGIFQRILAHEFSSNRSMLTIWYYDDLMHKTYMTICHTSRIHYYVMIDGAKTVKRTAKELIAFLDEFLAERLTWQDYQKQLSGMELNAFYHSTASARAKRYADWKAKRLKELS